MFALFEAMSSRLSLLGSPVHVLSRRLRCWAAVCACWTSTDGMVVRFGA